MSSAPEPRVRVLGVSGSLRRDSYNNRLLARAAQLLPAQVEYVRFEHLKAVPPFDQDDEAEPGAGATKWRQSVERADALLVSTPEYNSSVPGQLKNAIDWASRPSDRPALRGKDVAVIGASTGMFGAVWAQAEVRKALAAAGARVLDRELAVCEAHAQFDDDGRLSDGALEEGLQQIVTRLVAEANTSIAARLSASLAGVP
jgi:chromate reductase, NAD(P)H dehydrogenase (quinone)